jgi:hypothetical protein
MRYWVTTFPLSAAACSTLTEAGLQPWPGGSLSPDADSLLLYDSPDQLIAFAGLGPEHDGLTTLSLVQGYRQLLGWSEQTGHSLLAISQLQHLGTQGLRAWLADGEVAFPSSTDPQSLIIPPLLASVTIRLLEAEPELLDCYLDLELRAKLLGRDPDFRYHERLRKAGKGADALLHAFITSQRGLAAVSELEQGLVRRDTELNEMREAAELSLLQLHRQVQEEREHYLLADGVKQSQLEARDRELEELRGSIAAQERSQELELQALRELLEPRLAELEQCLVSKDTEIQQARE